MVVTSWISVKKVKFTHVAIHNLNEGKGSKMLKNNLIAQWLCGNYEKSAELFLF